MTSDPAYIRDFKEFTRGNLVPSDLRTFEEEAYGGNDRARAIMLSIVTENALDDYVRSKMRANMNSDARRQLFGFDGILGSFGAQTILAYSFGWIGDDTKHDLDHIRVVRNGFAHCLRAFDFDTPQCAEVCSRLRSPDDQGVFIPHGYLNKIHDDYLMAAHLITTPRTRFVMACHIVAERLLAAAHPDEYDGIRAP